MTHVENNSDGSINVRSMLGSINSDTKLVICVTPNNPTGLMLSKSEMVELCEKTPDDVLLFIDEAYYEFAIHAGGPNVLEILKNRRGPWVVTRTFSKAYALAGIRLGYAICSSNELVNAIRMVSSTFNLNGMAEAAAIAAWEEPEYSQFILDRNAEERQRVIKGLKALGFEPMDSVTNFVSCNIERPAQEVVTKMRERGIRISTVGGGEFENFIRLSMGLPEDTDAFLTAIKEILE